MNNAARHDVEDNNRKALRKYFHVPSTRYLDLALRELQGDFCEDLMTEMIHCLRALRLTLNADQWKAWVSSARAHPIFEFVLHCPFTRHAFERPFGYPGDASLLDHLYFRSLPDGVSERGQRLFRYTTDSPASQAVNARMRWFAKLIDDDHSAASVLSVACGHLREAEFSERIKNGQVEVTAFDQDEISLDQVKHSYGKFQIRPQQGTVRNLLSNKHQLDSFDLIYCGGLFDYLNDRIATALIDSLCKLLNPNGKLVIANLTPNMRDVGYMECFMDWWLIYRSEQDLKILAESIDCSEAIETSIEQDASGQVAFLQVKKVGD
jgi:SAM-dependent methyltransferase